MLEGARETVLANIRRIGWVTQRLLAAAENDRLWRRFTAARGWVAAAVAVTAICIAGFLISVQEHRAVTRSPGHCPSACR